MSSRVHGCYTYIHPFGYIYIPTFNVIVGGSGYRHLGLTGPVASPADALLRSLDRNPRSHLYFMYKCMKCPTFYLSGRVESLNFNSPLQILCFLEKKRKKKLDIFSRDDFPFINPISHNFSSLLNVFSTHQGDNLCLIKVTMMS